MMKRLTGFGRSHKSRSSVLEVQRGVYYCHQRYQQRRKIPQWLRQLAEEGGGPLGLQFLQQVHRARLPASFR